MKGKRLQYNWIKIALLLSAILFCKPSAGQDGKNKKPTKIKIVNADIFKKDENIPDAQKLIGNVQFEHDGVNMYCDSAYLYNSDNSLDAFSRVQINQGDTINVFSDTLYFNGNTKLAKFRGNVRLRDRDYKLDTDSMDYDVDKSIGVYRNFGKITSVKDDNVLTSIVGKYEADKKKMYFKDSVRLVNPDYIFESDTLEYETEPEIAYFFGPTFITMDSTFIYCEKGMYDTNNEVAQLVKEAFVETSDQWLIADSIYYEKKSEVGEGFGCVSLIDTTQGIHYTGDYAYRNEGKKTALMYNKALLRQYEGEDTLYIHADTLKINTQKKLSKVPLKNYEERRDTLNDKDSLNISVLNLKDTVLELTTIEAYYGVNWMRDKMRGVCDSMHYSELDSLLKMFGQPAIWNDSSQITGDTLFVRNFDGKTEGFNVYSNAFIIQIADSLKGYFSQIKGKDMEGVMKKNSIRRVEVIGNGETIYFIEEEEEAETADSLSVQKEKSFTGMNYIKCSNMIMVMKNKKVNSISFIKKPDGVMRPIDQLVGVKTKIKGFRLRFSERPDTIQDLLNGYNKKVTGTIPDKD